MVRHFFRTNKATCQEWLLRVRMNVILAALYSGQPSVAVRNCFNLLQDMVEAKNTHVRIIIYNIYIAYSN